MHVDPDCSGFANDPPNDRSNTDHLPPTAALTGANDDLGDLIVAGESGQCSSEVVCLQLVPACCKVGRQVPQSVDGLRDSPVAGISDDDMNDVELTLDPSRDASGPAQKNVGPRCSGDGDHDPLGRLPEHLNLVATEVFEKIFLALLRQEPQRHLPQRDQVIGAEEVSESLSHLLLG